MSGPERTGAPDTAADTSRAPTDGARGPAGGHMDVHALTAPGSAATAVALTLQRSAGNAAVARLVCGPRALSRLPTISAGPLQNAFTYGSDDFNGRYDGTVDGGSGLITLRMRVSWTLAPEFVDKRTGEFSAQTLATYTRFRARFKEVVERIWSGAHNLKPAGLFAGPPEGFRTQVRVTEDDSNPHAQLTFYPQTIDASTGEAARSCAKAASIGSPGTAALQDGDDTEKEHTLDYKGQKLLFYGNTCAHEFGHLLGLSHINEGAPIRKDARGQWTDVDRYGVTPGQAMDIMGMGNVISARDMAPFIRVAERFGRDHAPKGFNAWSVVDAS